MSIIRLQDLTPDDLARFWAKVMIPFAADDECWTWQGKIHRDGHGQFKLNGRLEYAHRIAWAILNGETPDRLLCHRCPGIDNPACINPEHLYAGDHRSNAFDYWRQRRASDAMREHYARKDAAA